MQSAFYQICLLAGLSLFTSLPCLAEQNKTVLKTFSQASLQATVDKTAKELLVPGAVVFLRTPQGKYCATYGTTEIGVNNKPQAETNFRIASNTKTMTAAVILLLAQEGKLKLSDPISRFVPNVPNGDKITIANLLEMRSGLYNYLDAPVVAETVDKNPSKEWTAEELLKIAFKHSPSKLPQTSYEYNNTNYALLGLVAEKVDHRSLQSCMQERLFKPLKMDHTSLPSLSDCTIPKPYSHGYLYGGASVAFTGDPPYTQDFVAKARAGKISPKDFTNTNHSFATAAGGATSTAKDLSKWIESLVTGKVFDEEYQQRWLKSIKPEDPEKPDGAGYGYGIAQLKWAKNTYYYHGGETVGFNSFMGFDPENRITLVVWTNLTVSLEQSPTANSIMLKVLEHIYADSPSSQ